MNAIFNPNAAPVEQFHEHYAHGGGWSPFEGFSLDLISMALEYPGDPTYYPLAKIQFRKESIYVYQYSWVVIVQEDGTWEVSRMD